MLVSALGEFSSDKLDLILCQWELQELLTLLNTPNPSKPYLQLIVARGVQLEVGEYLLRLMPPVMTASDHLEH